MRGDIWYPSIYCKIMQFLWISLFCLIFFFFFLEFFCCEFLHFSQMFKITDYKWSQVINFCLVVKILSVLISDSWYIMIFYSFSVAWGMRIETFFITTLFSFCFDFVRSIFINIEFRYHDPNTSYFFFPYFSVFLFWVGMITHSFIYVLYQRQNWSIPAQGSNFVFEGDNMFSFYDK